MKWNSAASSHAVLLSHLDAWSGTSPKSRPGWLHADRPQLSARSLLMSGNGGHARFESRVRLKQWHRRRDEHRNVLLASDPGVDDIRPLLHHMAALNFV